MGGKLIPIWIAFLVMRVSVDAWDKGVPVELGDGEWSDVLKGEWLVKFYAPWCPACRTLSPIWHNIAGWCADVNIKIGQVDITKNPGLTGRFMVKSLPSIYHIKDGDFRIYHGLRDEYELISYLDDKKWEQQQPLAWYRKPTSVTMASLGMFFQAAMTVRDIHEKLTSDIGLPAWVSYSMFAFLTVVLGFLLGVAVVCLCDFFIDKVFPPNATQVISHIIWPPKTQDVGGGGDDGKSIDVDAEADEAEVTDDVIESVEDSLRAEDQFVGGDYNASQPQQQQRDPNSKCFRRSRPMDTAFI
ncbi:Thioredoxin-related transmembrane protein 1 [Lamellibrachia satsuma]|nr:Thioredoxin-related transmembrane protein 1 [Lamellibrachia satsuma]